MQTESLSREEKIAKVIREGREIAEKLRKVHSVKEFRESDSRVDSYTDFVDENFGVFDEDVKLPRKESSLSRLLYILISSKFRVSSPDSEKAPIFKRDAENNFHEFERYLDSKEWATNVDDVGSDVILTNSSLTRDQKIAMVKAEGHAIAEKMKKINDIRELDAMNGRIYYFTKYVNQEFGEHVDGLSNLSVYFLDVVEDKEYQTLFYPDDMDISKKFIEQEFESYLDKGDWYSKKDAK